MRIHKLERVEDPDPPLFLGELIAIDDRGHSNHFPPVSNSKDPRSMTANSLSLGTEDHNPPVTSNGAANDTTDIEELIETHPLTLSLRQNPVFTESRPHKNVPEPMRAHNLMTGALAGPHAISIPPYVFNEENGKSMTMIMHLGRDICGHPGIIHGGLLATLLDEGLARCCFPALPSGVGVTANLNIDYRAPAPVDGVYVLRAETARVQGRKAWVDGRIETLPVGGCEAALVAEARALFIEPKQVAVSHFLGTWDWG